MHAAPPVRVSLGRSAGWIAFVSLCAGVAGANGAAWLLSWADASVGAAAVLGLLVAALAALRLMGTQERCELNWNGSQWQWREVTGELNVALDLNAWMLLRFDPVQGKRRWIAASRMSAIGPWTALRAALYARRPDDPLAP